MKNIFTAFFALVIILALVAQPVFAGGGQVQGEKGEGEVARIQDGPCPFGGDTPVGPHPIF
jgi:hypothetical protein